MKRKLFLGLLLLQALVLAGAVSAEEKPVGKLSIEGKSLAVGIGYSWGSGTLAFQGKEYPVSMSGLTLISAGFTTVSITGDVYNLKDIADFPGKYVAGKAGIALGGGASAVGAKNAKGVSVQLRSTQSGIEFTFGPEGLTFKLE